MNYAETKELKIIVKKALAEDIGLGILQLSYLYPKDPRSKQLSCQRRSNCLWSAVAKQVFKQLDKNISFTALINEGAAAKKNDVIAKISGKTRSILSAERVALNFLGFLSGIATKPKLFVEAIQPYKTKILDTRKTIPGLRALENTQ